MGPVLVPSLYFPQCVAEVHSRSACISVPPSSLIKCMHHALSLSVCTFNSILVCTSDPKAPKSDREHLTQHEAVT